MASHTDPKPTYACQCLNVKIFATAQSVSPEEGWQSVSVDGAGIKINYEHLTSKERFADGGQTVSCRLCNTKVYRRFDSVDSSSKSNVSTPLTPSKERPELESFLQSTQDSWIQVYTGQNGAISASRLDATLDAASGVFGVVLPSESSISPAPTPPTSNNPLAPVPVQQLMNWSDLFPPVQFLSNHPMFTQLSREAKKAAAEKRQEAEEEIRRFIEQKKKEVLAAEGVLKAQVQLLWKAWKDTQDSASIPKSVDPRTHTRRQSSAASTNSKSSGPFVIRSFDEQPVTRQPVHPSSFSPSTMTPRPAPMSALATSLKQSAMHMPRPLDLSPTSPTTKDSAISGDGSAATPTTRSKVRPTVTPVSPVAFSPPRDITNQPKRQRPSALKRQSMDSKKDSSPPSSRGDMSASPSGTTSPSVGSFTGKRKAVTFSSEEPDVVTVTRQIKAEKLQKIKEEHARGEEAMFDLDELDSTTGTTGISSPGKENFDDSASASRPAKKPRRIVGGFDDDDQSVRLSFGTSPTGKSNGVKKMEYTMARSLPTTSILSSSRLGLKISPTRPQKDSLVSSLEGPHAAEFRRMMAGQTPSHRAAWQAGSYDPRAARSDESDGDDHQEDMDEEDSSAYLPSIPLPSTSVPLDIPSMVRPMTDSADNNFEGAMSRSVDPGFALEADDPRYYDDQEAQRDLEEDLEAEDMMKNLIEGRGSLHAQKILSHQNRGIPASMWRSMA